MTNRDIEHYCPFCELEKTGMCGVDGFAIIKKENCIDPAYKTCRRYAFRERDEKERIKNLAN